MTELLTAAQMRAIEQAAIDSGDVTGLELMERAGRGVVEAIFEEWPELAKPNRGASPSGSPGYLGPRETRAARRRAVVLCGPGNNGGDGFVVARRLLDKGWDVEVFLFGDPDKLPPDARTNYDVWCSMGAVKKLEVDAVTSGPRPTLLIDAMFGTGLTRAIPLDCALAFHAIEKRDVGDRHPWLVPYHRVAIDTPSGLDTDSGKFLLPEFSGDADDEKDWESHWEWWQNDASMRLLLPDLTISFHRRRLGHVLSDVSRKVVVCDIGLGKEDRHPAHLLWPHSNDVVRLLDFDVPKGRSKRAWPGNDLDKRRGAQSHKYTHGHALILSGQSGKGGAARLAARGALRIGAGLVTVAPTPGALQENAARLDAIMLSPVGDAPTLETVLADERFNALCLGPGLGQERARELVPVALAAERATVLDADALTAFADNPAGLFDMLHENCVLTPHAGEFARLFPDIAEKLNAPATQGPAYSKVDATREAAARAGCVVLFKGPDTVIAAPDGRCSINSAAYERSAPWLATAGTGDVLAGFVTGLLARGFKPIQAAETAAWMHVECALEFGPGLIAEDLSEMLPNVFRKLGV